jgi:hypothetical protein
LDLHEAEALDITPDADKEVTPGSDEDASTAHPKLEVEVPDTPPLWRTLVFAFVGLLEALGWLSYGVYNLINHYNSHMDYDHHLHPNVVGPIVFPFLIAISWVYAVVRSVVKPTATPPYDLFTVYCLHLVTGVLLLGGTLFDYGVVGSTPPLLVILALSANMAAVLILLVVVVSMPLEVPSNRVKAEDIVSHLISNL